MLYLQNVLAMIIDFTILDLRICFMDFSTAERLCRLVLLQGGCFCSCCFPSSSVLQDSAKQQNHDRFKFDDEHVTPCSEYAAIEDNYGGALCADSNLSCSEGRISENEGILSNISQKRRPKKPEVNELWKPLRIIGHAKKKADGFDSVFCRVLLDLQAISYEISGFLGVWYISLSKGINSKYPTWSLANVSPVSDLS